jgi:hypothetical protein
MLVDTTEAWPSIWAARIRLVKYYNLPHIYICVNSTGAYPPPWVTSHRLHVQGTFGWRIQKDEPERSHGWESWVSAYIYKHYHLGGITPFSDKTIKKKSCDTKFLSNMLVVYLRKRFWEAHLWALGRVIQAQQGQKSLMEHLEKNLSIILQKIVDTFTLL